MKMTFAMHLLLPFPSFTQYNVGASTTGCTDIFDRRTIMSKRLWLSIAFLGLSVLAIAQSTFVPFVYKPKPMDTSSLERSLERLEERRRNYENSYITELEKYSAEFVANRYDMALLHLDRCININEMSWSNGWMLQDPGLLYEKKGDLLLAANHEAEALNAYKKSLKNYWGKTESLKIARKMLSISNTNDNKLLLASCLVCLKNYDEALNLVNSVNQFLVPIEVKIKCLVLLSEIDLQHNNYSNAINHLDEAIKCGGSVDLFAEKAHIESIMGNLSDAVQDYEYFFKDPSGIDEYFLEIYYKDFCKCQYLLAKENNNIKVLKRVKKELKELSKYDDSLKIFLKD